MQTEDKGVDTPLMLTLVYTRGEILASKRVRYDDLIKSGFDEKILAVRLLRQHKLICAAVRAGRLEELKKMTERESASRSSTIVEPFPESAPPFVESTLLSDSDVVVIDDVAKPRPSVPPRTRQRLPSASQRSSSRAVPSVMPEPVPADVEDGAPTITALHLVLIDEKKYRGGDRVMLRVLVASGDDQRQVVPEAEVIVKILGSTFRPMIYQSQAGTDGIAVFRTELPHFRSGRAAILIRATAGRLVAELRRIIQQG